MLCSHDHQRTMEVVRMEKQKPRKTFRAGSVRATIWDNEVTLQNGHKTNMARVCVERRYKNPEGEWTSTNYFNTNELGRLQAVIRAAFDYLVLHERESQTVADAELMAAPRDGGYDDVKPEA